MADANGKTRAELPPWKSSRVANRRSEPKSKSKEKNSAPASQPSGDSLQSSRWAPNHIQPSSPSSPSKSAARTLPSTSTSTPTASPSKSSRPSVEGSGLRPRDLSKPLGGKLDPMSLLASPSRGLDQSRLEGLIDGDITDLHVQVQYRAHISEQVRKHASKFSPRVGADEAKPDDTNARQASLSNLILLARKLREGLLAGLSGKAKQTEDPESTNLFIEVSQLSIALSLLSEPPNLAQLHATIPRLVDALVRHQSSPSLSGRNHDQLCDDTTALLDMLGPEATRIASVLANVSEDGLAHILSLQFLLALHSGTSTFGHTEYLSLRAEFSKRPSSSASELFQHPHINFIQPLHRSLLQKDVVSVRNIILSASASQSLTFWHLRLLLSSSSSAAETLAQHQHSEPPSSSATPTTAHQNLVGTTSNSTASQTTAILDQFRAIVWDSLAKAYRPMGIPIDPALVDRLSPEAKTRLSTSQGPQTHDATWLERILLLDDDIVLSFQSIRGNPASQTRGDTLPSRSTRIDNFLTHPARKLGGSEWPSRVDVRADGQTAVLRLK
ncbi:unnamed protein product [Tilletia controversa]|nr:unnamed protein product [Tilletia controversa]CAD6908912.1 unnamed protein product [Tilletia controversa]CAD6930213.1 unnamed protein product [Tilletia controversa]CAD6956497.1 unnamed protein product [Tilletia controversa]CAD6982279.1 unnamed protein product [Tilletia controversa]